MNLPRHCIDCGTITRNGSRCPTCDRRNHQAAYGSGWRTLARRMVTIAARCACQGCTLHDGRCSATDDLTVDHIRPHARGGGRQPGNLRVVCRRCNSAKRDRQR